MCTYYFTNINHIRFNHSTSFSDTNHNFIFLLSNSTKPYNNLQTHDRNLILLCSTPYCYYNVISYRIFNKSRDIESYTE